MQKTANILFEYGGSVYRHNVPRLIHSPSLHKNVLPVRQTVELVATVLPPSSIQVRPPGIIRIGESPPEQEIPRLFQAPSSHRYCVPA
jgi:hypothetical protein